MIPKILHQLWIGPKNPPLNMMNTWKEKHPGFEYIFWNEDEIEKRNMTFQCQKEIDEMSEYNGKADIMRWEILYKYGGYFIDADSICIEPFDEYFDGRTAFATFENEIVRSQLVATGTMGFIPKHPMCKDIIDWILTDEYNEMNKNVRAWGTVGPGAITRFLKTGKYKDFSVYPSHCFLPIHFTGLTYSGHKKVYAYQAWGTTNNNYDDMNSMTIPPQLREPRFWISILIPSYNTPQLYLRECLDSIKLQEGHFSIEIVWINDGSNDECSQILEKELDFFMKTSRFCKLKYHKFENNMGVSYSLNYGVNLCSNELIFRMDSDDIMLPERIQKQIDFMKNTKNCVICGSNIQMFSNYNSNNLKEKTFLSKTEHVSKLTWNDFLNKLPKWFMNHPTICFRKSAVLNVGNYNINHGSRFILEDYELELKLMKKYFVIYNLDDVLVLYRLHKNQVTNGDMLTSGHFVHLRNNIIRDVITNNI